MSLTVPSMCRCCVCAAKGRSIEPRPTLLKTKRGAGYFLDADGRRFCADPAQQPIAH